jgi:hypothetical protein
LRRTYNPNSTKPTLSSLPQPTKSPIEPLFLPLNFKTISASLDRNNDHKQGKENRTRKSKCVEIIKLKKKKAQVAPISSLSLSLFLKYKGKLITTKTKQNPDSVSPPPIKKGPDMFQNEHSGRHKEHRHTHYPGDGRI